MSFLIALNTAKRLAIVSHPRPSSFSSFKNIKINSGTSRSFSWLSSIQEKRRNMCTSSFSSSINEEIGNTTTNTGSTTMNLNEEIKGKEEMQETTGNSSPKFMEDEGEVHEFKAETRKLLHIVTHSLYTDKEVFIRELISNASDSLEKLRFLQATGQVKNLLDEKTPLQISIFVDPKAKTITFEDTGVGMERDELISNLGTIAKSGSLNFLKQNSSSMNDKANAIIGQFGVGFYSAFVVSRKVEVFSRSFNSLEDGKSKGTYWNSDGLGSFTVKDCEGLPRGTKIVCHLKDECLEFCNAHTAKSSAQKFSSFVSFPLFIKEGEQLTELNKQNALWLKPQATEEEHLTFFRYLNNSSYGEPMYTIMYKTDAPLLIKSLFYIPEEAPSRLFQSKTEVGVSLHSKRVLVKKSAEEIIPKWLFFIKGVVDCEDIPLNVSRENMQDSILIDKLSFTLIKRILRFLQDQSTADPIKYAKFYQQYSYHLKEGLLEDTQKSGKYKDDILKLLRFECSGKDAKECISLDEYISRMKPNQKNIYYFCASDRNTAMASPYMEDFHRRKRDVILMYDDIDEYVAMNIQNYKDKKFVSLDSPDGDFEPLLEDLSEIENQQEKTQTAKLVGEQQTELENYIKSVLGQKVTAVKFSDRLTNSPGIVSGFLSATLRKMMKATMKGAPDAQMSLASLPATLELNPSHPIVTSLYHLKTTNPAIAKLISEQLYDNACVAAGILEDPRSMLDRLNNILEVTSQYAYHHHANAVVNDHDNTDNIDLNDTANINHNDGYNNNKDDNSNHVIDAKTNYTSESNHDELQGITTNNNNTTIDKNTTENSTINVNTTKI